eukprot:8838704-Alexandrium_andersonii.AAC.1
MSASLVGSEMCIRDRAGTATSHGGSGAKHLILTGESSDPVGVPKHALGVACSARRTVLNQPPASSGDIL